MHDHRPTWSAFWTVVLMAGAVCLSLFTMALAVMEIG